MLLNSKFYRRKVSWCWFSKCYSKLAEKLLTAFTIHFPSKISSESQRVEINKFTHEDNFITSFNIIFTDFCNLHILPLHIVAVYLFDWLHYHYHLLSTWPAMMIIRKYCLFLFFTWVSIYLSGGRGGDSTSKVIQYQNKKNAQISTEMKNYQHKRKII